jgi:hypothetical protein
MRAEPWLDEIRHGINLSISFGCDYCATTRRERDVACWSIATFPCDAELGRYRGIAQIEQAAPMSTRFSKVQG